MPVPLPPEFSKQLVDAEGVTINTLVGGSGPPVLLLHGYPQTHLIWHHVAPRLARTHTVVLTDLRGYGDSAKPRGSETHREYAKRTMARDQLLVMRTLGFSSFAVVGHDRGARVGHRLALDHPAAVSRLAVLDIVPTRYALQHADTNFRVSAFHWYFLAVGNGVPERLLGAEPEFWVRSMLQVRHPDGHPFDPAALDEYVRCFSDPATIHASCEDYRAGLTSDFADDDHDAAQGRKVTCPLLALWGERSFVGRTYDDVLTVWREYADDVRGRALPCGHFLPEEAPDETAATLESFLTDRVGDHVS